MQEPTVTSYTYRTPLYRGLVHFIASYLRVLFQQIFKLSLRDCRGEYLKAGDRVFDLNHYYLDRTYSDPANYGTIVSDDHSISGLSIQWDNDERSQLIDSSMLIKKYV